MGCCCALYAPSQSRWGGAKSQPFTAPGRPNWPAGTRIENLFFCARWLIFTAILVVLRAATPCFGNFVSVHGPPHAAAPALAVRPGLLLGAPVLPVRGRVAGLLLVAQIPIDFASISIDFASVSNRFQSILLRFQSILHRFQSISIGFTSVPIDLASVPIDFAAISIDFASVFSRFQSILHRFQSILHRFQSILHRLKSIFYSARC